MTSIIDVMFLFFQFFEVLQQNKTFLKQTKKSFLLKLYYFAAKFM